MVEGARLESVYRLTPIEGSNPSLTARKENHRHTHYGDSIGPLATIGCKLRQARKGATVAIDSCAEMWLVELPPKLNILVFL